MKRYCISVTYDCNWNCSYCFANGYKSDRSYEKVLSIISDVEEGSSVNLSGGEPGLLSSLQLMEIVSILKDKGCEVYISSNGAIFNHPEVCNIIDGIYYHCTVDMEPTDVVNRDYIDKTLYLVIVTDDNIKNLSSFLENNSDISIDIYPAQKSCGSPGLSKKNLLNLVKTYKDTISDFNLEIMLDYRKHMIGRTTIK